MTVIEVCENGCLVEGESPNTLCPKCNGKIIFSKKLEESSDVEYFAQIKAQTINEAKTLATEIMASNPNAIAAQIKLQKEIIENLGGLFRNEMKKLGSRIENLSKLLDSLKALKKTENKNNDISDIINSINPEILSGQCEHHHEDKGE